MVATISIRSVKIHTLKHLRPATDGDGGEGADAATMTATGDRTITYPVSIRVFEVPAPDPLSDESLIVVVAQPIGNTPGHLISQLVVSGG